MARRAQESDSVLRIRRGIGDIGPPALASLPARFRDVKYVSSLHPCAPGVSGVEAGANCQQYAYELLRHYGLNPPALRSSELFADEQSSRLVASPEPLDLLLYNATHEPFGAHVAVFLNRGRAVHLSAEEGSPVVWSLEEFQQRERYRVLVGIKRIVRTVDTSMAPDL